MAYFDWQSKSKTLWGLKEGHENSVDDLADTILENADNTTLDTYILPIFLLSLNIYLNDHERNENGLRHNATETALDSNLRRTSSHHRTRISFIYRIKYQIHLSGKGDEHVHIQTQTDRHSAIGASEAGWDARHVMGKCRFRYSAH